MSHTGRVKYLPRPTTFIARETRAEIVEIDVEREIARDRFLIGVEIKQALARYGEGWLDYDTFVACRVGAPDAGALRAQTGDWVVFDEKGQWKYWREVGEGDEWFTPANPNMRAVLETITTELQSRADEQFYFEMEMDEQDRA